MRRVKGIVAIAMIMVILICNTVNVKAEAPYQVGYTCTDAAVYKTRGEDVERYLIKNTLIYYEEVDEGWVKLAETGEYIKKDTIGEKQTMLCYEIPQNSGKKSWMGDNLFGTGTNQYAVQQLATTDKNGLKKVGNRYCVAVGSHFGLSIGQKFDLILENNTVIPCVMGDQKADCHTDAANIFTVNGCCSEFIVDSSCLNEAAKFSGDISSINERWQSPVKMVATYEDGENVLE